MPARSIAGARAAWTASTERASRRMLPTGGSAPPPARSHGSRTPAGNVVGHVRRPVPGAHREGREARRRQPPRARGSRPTTSRSSACARRRRRRHHRRWATCSAGLVLVVLAALPDLLDGAVAKAVRHRQPAGRLLRLGRRPGHRHAAVRRRGAGTSRPTTAAARWPCCPWPSWACRRSSPTSGPRPSRSGLEAKGGLMERAERIILLCLGLLLPVLLVPILW